MLEVLRPGEITPASAGTMLVEAQSIEQAIADTRDGAELLQNLTIATPIYVGRVGAVGFGILVRRPDFPRPSYIGSDRVSGVSESWDDLSRDEQVATGLDTATDEERARHIGTQNGFIIVRQTLLPSGLSDFLSTDPFIGEGMIHKFTREVFNDNDNLGEDYNHDVADLLESSDVSYEDDPYTRVQSLTGLVAKSLANGQLPVGSRLILARSYASWHGYPYFHKVIANMSDACRTTVDNFDAMADRFNINTPQFALKA